MVLLSRVGRLLGFAALALRPEHAVPVLAWAPSGLSMAFAEGGRDGAELGIWAIGSKPVSVAFPDVSGSYGRCMWSPDGSSILCPDGFSRPAAWAIASATGERMVQVSAPAGVSVAWLPSRGSRRIAALAEFQLLAGVGGHIVSGIHPAGGPALTCNSAWRPAAFLLAGGTRPALFRHPGARSRQVWCDRRPFDGSAGSALQVREVLFPELGRAAGRRGCPARACQARLRR